MANNAEILAQLERLAEARANARDGSDRNAATMLLSVAHDTNFGPILAAFKRLVKIEEAARGIISNKRRYSICTDAGIPSATAACAEYLIGAEWVNTLDAALKEPQ